MNVQRIPEPNLHSVLLTRLHDMRHVGLGWCLFAASLFATVGRAAEPVVSRIAFGACAKQDQPQPIWDAIVALQPQRFVFLGDNIHGDTEDMAVLKAKYDLLGNQPGYRKLKQTCPVLATWDDHDYGGNDAGVEYPKKRESQQLFLDFFDVPKDDSRRQQEGVHSSHLLGPPGKRIHLILLDSRYFRSPLKKGFQPGELRLVRSDQHQFERAERQFHEGQSPLRQ